MILPLVMAGFPETSSSEETRISVPVIEIRMIAPHSAETMSIHAIFLAVMICLISLILDFISSYLCSSLTVNQRIIVKNVLCSI